MKKRLLNRKVSVLSFVWIFLTFLPLATIAQDKYASKERARLEKQMKKLCRGKKVSTTYNLNYITVTSQYEGNAGGLFSNAKKQLMFSEKVRDQFMKTMEDVFYFGYCYDWDYSKNADFTQIYNHKYFFLPKSGKTNGVFPNQTIDFNDINKKGKGYIYLNNHYTNASGYWAPSYKGEERFVLINDIYWSGEIKNGCLEGNGEGYCIYEADNSHIYHVITYVKGQFHNGYPTGECSFVNIFSTHEPKFYKSVTKTNIEWFNENNALLQIDFNGKNNTDLYLDEKMEIHSIRGLLSHFCVGSLRFYKFIKNVCISNLKFTGFSGDNIIAEGTAYNFLHADTSDAILRDSVNMEIMVSRDKRWSARNDAIFVGLSEKGKGMVVEYLNKVARSLDLLMKVYNTSDLSDPINNLKQKYNIDYEMIKNQMTTVDALKKDIPDVKAILKDNKDLSTRLSLIQDLVDVYRLLDVDDVAEVTAKAKNYDARDASIRVYPSQGEMWIIHNWVDKPTRVTDKRMSDDAVLNKMLNNPLFPIKDQNIEDKLKALVESKKATYMEAYPQIYELAASRLRKEVNIQGIELEIIETDNIPEIISSSEKISDREKGEFMYTYRFEDGVYVTIFSQRYATGQYEYCFFLESGSLKQAYYTNLSDAKCAAYFWEKYRKLRNKGKR